MKYLKNFKQLNESNHEISGAKEEIEEVKSRMNDIKKRASEDPFSDEMEELKSDYNELKNELSELEEELKNAEMRYLAQLGSEPFKYETEEEFLESLKKVTTTMGYTKEDLYPTDGVYAMSKYQASFRTKMPDEYKKEHRGYIYIPKNYSTYCIVIENGKMVARPMVKKYWGMIPDDKSYAQYGTSGHNNPAPTSNLHQEWEVNTIGDVAAACLDMMAIPKESNRKYGEDFAAYLRAGGRDWD